MTDKGNRFSDEGQPLPIIDSEICTACEECVNRCPLGALGVVDGEVAIVHPELCTYCGDCEEACPKEGIDLPFEVVFLESPEQS